MGSFPDSAQDILDVILSSMGEAVIIVEPEDRTITNCNAAAEELFGYEREELIGQETEILHIDREHYEQFGKIGEPVLKKQQVFRTEYQMQRKDGTVIDTYNTVSPIKEELGWEAGVVSIIRDITEQKKAERNLKSERDRLREAQRIGKIGDWYFDLESEEITWMPMMFEIYERDPGQGSPTYEELQKYYPDNLEYHDRMVEKAIDKGESYSYDIKIQTGKGNEKYVHVEGKPRLNDQQQVVKLYGTVQDITERKKAERERIRREQEIETLFSNLPGMAYRCRNNQSYTMEFVSGGCKTLTGYEPEQLLHDREIAYGALIHPDDSDRVWEEVQQALKQNTHFEIEYRIQTKDEEEKWVWERGIAISKDHDEEVTLQGFISDITQRKSQEQQLEQLLKQKDTLIQEIHHRVKNNMAIISGLLELQKNKLGNSKAIDALNLSQLRIYTMANVHEQLYREKDLTDIWSKNYIENLLDLHQNFYTGSNIHIKSDIDSFELNVNQAIPLGLLLNELITNACKHAFKKGEQGTVTVGLRLQGNTIQAQVKDDGGGMHEDIRVDTPETLGFTIINTLTKQLNASMDIESSDDGTCVTLDFKREEPKGSSSNLGADFKSDYSY